MCTLVVIMWQICIQIRQIWIPKSKSDRFRF